MDIAFEAVGSRGKFQKITVIVIILVSLMDSLMSNSFPFMTKKPDFYCKEKNSLNVLRICADKDLCKQDFFEYNINPLTSLNNWAYDFELFCSKSYFSPIIRITYLIGGICGTVFLSSLPDKYGRKEIYKMLLIAMFVLHLNVFLAVNEWHVLFANTLLGVVGYASSMSSVILTEYIDRDNRATIMSLKSAVVSFSGIFVALFFLWVNNWRVLFFFITSLAFLCLLLNHIYFVESPRWLNSKNKFSETLSAFKKIAEINDCEDNFNKFISVNDTLIKKTKCTLKEIKKSYNIYQVFQFKSQRRTLSILTYFWFCTKFCSQGLFINLENSSDIITDSLVFFGAQIVSTMISGYLADKFGRLFVLKIFGFTCGFGFFLHEITSNQKIKTFTVLLTSFALKAISNVISIYSAELIPTIVRSTVMGYFKLAFKLGALTVPIVTGFFPHPQLLFGVFAFVLFYFCFQLKETLGKEMQDDIPEVVRRSSFLSIAGNPASRRASKSYFSLMTVNKEILSDSFLKIKA